MKKLILIMVAALTAFGAFAQDRHVSIYAGVGTSSIYGDSFKTIKTNWNAGIGYEFTLSSIVGLQPAIEINSKGYTESDSEMGLLYLDVPVMVNFHLGSAKAWQAGVGPYFGYLVDGGDLKDVAESFDIGLKANALYNFKNGIFLGLDLSNGVSQVLDKKHNVTLGLTAGIRF